MGSRPYGESIWDGSGAVISVSPGALGIWGQSSDSSSPCVFECSAMQQPEAYIGIADYMDESGNIKNESTLEYLKVLWNHLQNGLKLIRKRKNKRFI